MRIPLDLRSKLAIAFLLILIPVLGLVIYDYLDDYRRAQNALLESHARTTQVVASLLDATLDQAVEVGRALVLDPTIRTLSSTDPSLLDPYLARYLPAYPEFENINVWDANGQNVGSSAPPPAAEPRPNIADREHFQWAVATGRPAVSGVIISRIGGRPTVAVALPIDDRAGRTTGVVTILLDFRVLAERLQSVYRQPTQEIWVADRTGRIAFYSARESMSWEERDISGYEPAREALARGQFAGIVSQSLDDGPSLVNASISPKYGWIAGVAVAERTVQASLAEGTLDRLAIYLTIALLGTLVAWGFTHSIISPLRDLTHTIAAFGRGELARRVHVRTGDELEATAETFNRMASALQREQDRLRFLGEVSMTLTSALEEHRIVQLLAERITEVLGESSWVCLLPGKEQKCNIVSSYTRIPGLNQRLLGLFERHDEWVTTNLFLPVARSGQPILIQDISSSWMEEGLRRELADVGGVSFMVVPMVARGRTLGILGSLCLNGEHRFGEADLALAMDLAGRGAAAIDNALLFQQVQNERRQLEELAREHERRRSELDAVIEGVSEGITLAGGEGRVVRINRQGKEILGIPDSGEDYRHVDRYVGQFELRYPDGRVMPVDQWPIARAVRGEMVSGMEAILVRRDGSRRNLLYSTSMVRDEQGRVRLAMSIFRDITQIRELEQAREEFISVVAHDLRSPLTVITGFAGLLQRLPPTQHGQQQEQKAVGSILTSARRLEKMVADLLDASRIEASRLILTKERVELPVLVHEVVERMAETTKGHTVREEVTGEIPVIHADPARLEQVLVNLLSNAVKYSYPSSEIVVELQPWPEGREVMVSVANQGPGIPPEDQKLLFTRFRRTQAAAEGKIPGLGLGLYITKGLVEAHGGHIWVESEMEKTTTFRFTLPVTSAES